MFARLLAFVVWAGVAGSAVFWGLKLFASPLAVPTQAVVALPRSVAGGDLTRLFGVDAPLAVAQAPPPPPESSRFQLIGVVTPRAAAAQAQGLALIAVDGKTARAYRVGTVIDGDYVLRAVSARGAAIGPRNGEVSVSLELPPLPPPATGVPGGALPAAVMVPVPPQFPMPAVPGAPTLTPEQAARLRAIRSPLTNPMGARAVMPAPVPADAGQPNADGSAPAPGTVTGDSRRQR